MPKNNFPALSRKRLIVVAVSACFASAPAWGNPTAPQVVNGSASFNQAGNLLTVNNSNGAIINWNTFSIGASETTRFIQNSASSSVLNRVITSDPSVLLGALSSNGRVWLVNPAGIMVGQGARIDVAGFVASTLSIRNEDFLAGRLNFGATPNAGSIQNYGQITTPTGGSVYLVAPNIENHGVINAPNGEVILAAGQTAQLIDTGTPGVKVDITGAEGNVTNLGEIVAEAGRIGIAGVLVRNSGSLDASSVVKEGGRIFLKASKDAYVDGAGRIVTTGTKGGSIEVLGNRVAVMDQAQLDASGDTGGGTVLIGGDAHGANPDVQNAQHALIGPDAVVRADAKTTGDGGRVIVWADGDTQFSGSVSARGGSLSGNGGFIETSGKQALQVAGGRVDTRAPRGVTGTWLLDPASDFVIDSGTAGTIATNMGSTSVQVDAFGDGSGSVGSVNFQANLDLAYGSGHTFTALAGENINLGAYNITASGHNVTLTANEPSHSGSGAGAITSSPGSGNITTYGGNVNLSGVAVTVGALNTSGKNGANGASGGTGNTGGAGGTVTISADTSIATGSITTTGGAGGAGGAASGTGAAPGALYTPGGAGGQGGTGGNVVISLSNSSGSIGTGDIITSGGPGGDGGDTTGYYDFYYNFGYGSGYSANPGGVGGHGGHGGQVAINLTSGSINGPLMSVGSDFGTINTSGASGGVGGSNTYQSSSGAQGYGGDIFIAAAMGDINFDVYPQLPISASSISTGGGSLQFVADNNINFGSALPDLSSVTTFGGSLQFKAGADINFSSSVEIPSSWQAALADTYGTVKLQFRAGNNIDLAYGGGPYTLTTNSQHVVLSANDVTTEPSWTLNTSGGEGSVIGNGNLITNGGDATLSGYGVAVGAITTSGPSDASHPNGNVSITTSGGDITTGTITTRALSADWSAGFVTLQTATGNILVTGNIDTRGADGDADFPWGRAGGDVRIFRTDQSTQGSIGVTGSILTYGGNALANSGSDGDRGGSVYIGGDQNASTAVYGSVSIGAIDAHGGDGASGGGDGGSGGSVTIRATDSVVTAAIDTHGGVGASSSGGDGGEGAWGGSVTIDGGSVATEAITTYGGQSGNGGNGNALSRGYDGGEGSNGGSVGIYSSGEITVSGVIDTHGGKAGDGGAFGGSGGFNYSNSNGLAGNVTLNAAGAVSFHSIVATGGDGGIGKAGGGSFSGGSGSDGGHGGWVDISGASISVVSGGTGTISTFGGTGGAGGAGDAFYGGGSGGSGGYGGNVGLMANAGALTSGSIDTHGGIGGDAGAGNSAQSGGIGGFGGDVDLSGSSIDTTADVIGAISTYGGSGGNGANNASNAGPGSNGGYGGFVYLEAASGAVIAGNIDSHGGRGGDAGLGTAGYNGADGGWGGTVEIYADSITTGSIFTRGGDGGNGGGDGEHSNYNPFLGTFHSTAGNGGDGGGIVLGAAGGAVMVNGSFDASGGAGGMAGNGYPGGSNGTAGNAATDYRFDDVYDVTIYGTSIAIDMTGSPAGTQPFGINLQNADLYSYGGPITLVGTAGTTGKGAGVSISNSNIYSYGGEISITGHGGNASDSVSWSDGVDIANASIYSSGGPLSITGTGGKYGGSWGVSIGNSSTVDAYGGTLSIMGTGGLQGSASHGVALGNAYDTDPEITSAGGSVNITGIGGGNTGTGPDTSKGVRTFFDTVSISGASVTINGTAGYGGDAIQLGDTGYEGMVIHATSAATIVSGGAFINNAGADAVSVDGGGRWLIYAPSPDKLTKGGLVATLYAYNTAYGGTVDPAGSGFVYASPLRVDANFTGSLSSTFGSSPTATPGYALHAADLDGDDTTTTAAITGSAAYSNWPITSSTAAGSYGLQYASGLSASPFYTLTPGTSQTYTVNQAILGIIAASLTGSASKTYDGTTTATLAPGNFLLSGFVSTDSASVTKTTGTYASKNVGSNILVSTTLTTGDFSPAGSTNLSNYTLPTSASGNIGVITPASLTVSGVTAQNKVYDATTAATIAGTATLTGIFGTDVVTVGGSASGSFADKNVGVAKPVSVTGLTLAGGDAGNYILSSTPSTQADITPASLTLSGLTAQNKVYDATTAATITGTGTFSGLLGTDVVTLAGSASGSFADKNVGVAKPVSVTGLTLSGTDAGNYTLTNTSASTIADITPASLTLSGLTAQNKVYDATTAATISGTATFSGVLGTDLVTLGGSPSGSFVDKNVGVAKPISVTGLTLSGADAGNYILTSTGVGTTADITPATLSLSGASAANKVYDGTTIASASGILSGVFSGDVVVAAGSGEFANKNVGTAKPVFASFSLSGTDAGNYTLSGTTASAFADITVRPLSTWIGGSSGNWSVASNWDALPDLSNVQAVSIPSGVSVTYDAAAGSTNLAALTAGALNLAGGSLNITDNLTVNSSFSQSGGGLAMGSGATVSLTQSGGNLSVPAFNVASLNLSAPAGAITQSGAIVASALNTQSQTGTTLNNAGNRISSFGAVNTGSGSISLTNASPLTITGISNTVGSIAIDNTGAVTTVGPVIASSGPVTIVGHSPVTIGAGGVSASGDIVLTAGNTSGSGDDLTLSGPVGSGGSVALTAGDDLMQGANVTTNGGAISATAQTGDIVLTSLNAGGGSIALNAANSIQSAPGYTGANLIGGSAVIVAGTNANLSTQVNQLNVTAGGNYSITNALTGTVTTKATAAGSAAPALNQVLSTVTSTTQQATQTTTEAATPTPPPATGGTGPQLLSNAAQSIGGTEGTFGGTSDSAEGKPADSKTASDKKDDKKDDDKKKDETSTAKKDDGKPAVKKLPTCS